MGLVNRTYYRIKPFIPRKLQITARRCVAVPRRRLYRKVWPIDPNAGEPPRGWCGWPDGKKFALVLTHDVETGNGRNKCCEVMNLDMNLGFRSSFDFVAKRYEASKELRDTLTENGFEVAIHGLYHDGRLFESKKTFDERAVLINKYLKEWGAVGFNSPSMHRNLAWIHELNIEYDQSTFDTDPFEPQPDGVRTIFPFAVYRKSSQPSSLDYELSAKSYELSASQPPAPRTHFPKPSPQQPEPSFFIEHPYTLPQDFTLFILLKEKNIRIWKEKLDWIAEKGGMALLNTHPDYMNCRGGGCGWEEYPIAYYEEFLHYVKEKYEGRYWHALPKEMARFWKETMVTL
jgi:hypothetical protein